MVVTESALSFAKIFLLFRVQLYLTSHFQLSHFGNHLQVAMSPLVILWKVVLVFLVLSCNTINATSTSGGDVQVPISSPSIQDVREQALAATEDDAIAGILSKIRAWQEDDYSHQTDAHAKSFVTLTYAQSLDGCVAVIDSETGETSSNLPLSGKSSLRLTHGLRSIHDAVLVGGTTFAVDNPRLNVRLWSGTNAGGDLKRRRQPRSVVLDTELKRLQILREKNAEIRAHNPIICCAEDVFDTIKDRLGDPLLSIVDMLPCKRDDGGRGLDLEDVLKQLRKQRGICSVMVEGGASILTAFANRGLINCLCVTIAPKLIGGGIGLNAFAACKSREKGSMPWCDFDDFDGSDCKFVPGFGSDCIFLARWPRSGSQDNIL